jgi:hypothetical protein
MVGLKPRDYETMKMVYEFAFTVSLMAVDVMWVDGLAVTWEL